MRFFRGILGAATTLGVLATGVGTINFTARSWAGRRLAERGDDLNAEAILLLF